MTVTVLLPSCELIKTKTTDNLLLNSFQYFHDMTSLPTTTIAVAVGINKVDIPGFQNYTSNTPTLYSITYSNINSAAASNSKCYVDFGNYYVDVSIANDKTYISTI